MRVAVIAFSFLAMFANTVHAGTLQYVGSSTVGKFVTDSKASFRQASIQLDTRPESSGGEQCAARGKCDIGGVAREVDPKAIARGAVATLIGKDAIAAVVHQDNPVASLSAAQLKGIFTGAIRNWSEVGGANLPIKPYIVKNGSATRKVFANVILQGAEYSGTEVITPDARMVSTVASDPAAIGQISFAFLVGQDGIKPLGVEGQRASVDNSGYPITRPLYLVTKGQPAGEAKQFIDWALSDAGQSVVKQRFVGVR